MTGTSDPSPRWTRRTNPFAARMAAGEYPMGIWVTMDWPPIVEVLAQGGVDAVFIDLEHTMFATSSILSMITDAELLGLSALVRPRALDPAEIGVLLDAGAHGVIAPNVQSPDDAALVRSATRYPPRGRRGWGGTHTRVSSWNADPHADVYSRQFMDHADNLVCTIFIIESQQGIDNLDAILDAGQPDAVSFGYGDFGASVGFEPAAISTAARRVHETCRERGVGVAITPGRAELPPYPGCYLHAGIEVNVMSAALTSHLRSLRERHPAPGT